MLRIFDELPPGLLDVEPAGLADALGGPSLIRMAGRRQPPLMVATLLHGNETTGWNALRELLGRYPAGTLPRSLLLFIGNVESARAGLRHLDGQPDFNRIWCDAVGPEASMAAAVLAETRRAAPFACIDVHNTSGENPVYACVHRLEGPAMVLSRRFGSIAVLVTHPESMLSMALSTIAPAITVECGKPGNEAVTRRMADALDGVMAMDDLDADGAGGGAAPELLRTVARVRIRDDVSFTFRDTDADLRFEPGLDRHNFALMPAGTPIAKVRDGLPAGAPAGLVATDEHGGDVSERFFRRRGETMVTAVPWIPSLFSANERIVRQDCLCYVMERV